MKRFVRKIRILCNSICGLMIKVYYDVMGLFTIKPLSSKDISPKIIVSLTSYGRRVSDTVYYSIVSILRQSMQPDRIILWLDDSWTEDRIPRKLKSLQIYGVEIYYCEDIKSYKKLIPTLKITESDIIVTIDDDVIYNRDLLLTLYNSYLINPHAIHCTQALLAKQLSTSVFDSYINWEVANPPIKSSNLVFPIGVGAILYPPKSLYKDVLRNDIFETLCPDADDIWFWIMAKLNHTEHVVVDLKPNYYSFDAIYQFTHKNTALTHTNRFQNKNDFQLHGVMQYYDLKF